MNVELITKAEAIARNAEVASIANVDDKGYPRVSTISNLKTDGLRKVWFATGLGSSKVKFFRKDSKASVCYRDGGNNVTLVGDVEIITSPELKEQLWQDWFIDHFPGGVQDPNYCILQFTTKEVFLWVDNQYEELLFQLGEGSLIARVREVVRWADGHLRLEARANK